MDTPGRRETSRADGSRVVRAGRCGVGKECGCARSGRAGTQGGQPGRTPAVRLSHVRGRESAGGEIRPARGTKVLRYGGIAWRPGARCVPGAWASGDLEGVFALRPVARAQLVGLQ